MGTHKMRKVTRKIGQALVSTVEPVPAPEDRLSMSITEGGVTVHVNGPALRAPDLLMLSQGIRQSMVELGL